MEYALHRLAYDSKNKLDNFNEQIWIPHLLYRLFKEKASVENITKIKIEKIKYIFSEYRYYNNFRTMFLSRYLDETNLTQIENYLKKYNSFIVNKDIKRSMFDKIPFPAIIYALLFILITKNIFYTEKNLDNNEVDNDGEEEEEKLNEKDEKEDKKKKKKEQ